MGPPDGPGRFQMVQRSFYQRLLPEFRDRVVWVLAVYSALMGVARRQAFLLAASTPPLVVGLMLAGYFGVYLVTPTICTSTWLLAGPPGRSGCWPSALLAFFLIVSAPADAWLQSCRPDKGLCPPTLNGLRDGAAGQARFASSGSNSGHEFRRLGTNTAETDVAQQDQRRHDEEKDLEPVVRSPPVPGDERQERPHNDGGCR